MYPNITNLIAIGSGKGGVGKSTFSVNLAFTLKQLGHKVGILDADIMGPTIHTMLCLTKNQLPDMNGELLVPADCDGVKVMSMGLLINDEQPATMRGAMISKYLKTFLHSVAWGELDYLIIDLPPGTGDTQISLCQATTLSGAVIVTTPQDISLKIALKGLKMFELVDVPILGIVENMSSFTCTNCKHETHLFGRDGGKRLSRDHDVPFLGAIGLDPDIVAAGDKGKPIIVSQPNSNITASYIAIAKNLMKALDDTICTSFKSFSWDWESNIGAPIAVQNDGRSKTHHICNIAKKGANILSIYWDDGVVSDLTASTLRSLCKCAMCKDKTIVPPDNILPLKINSVGNYAIRIIWNDGHSTGIYSFKFLRELAVVAV